MWFDLPAPVEQLVVAVGGGGVAIIVAKIVERIKGRGLAESAEFTTRAQLVRDMAKELGELRIALSAAWAREHEATAQHRRDMAEADRLQRAAFVKYQTDMDSLDRRWRHLARKLLQRDIALRHLLHKAGIADVDLPSFDGFDEFEREGGTIAEEWAHAMSDDGRAC